MYECDNGDCVKNGLPECDRWEGYATHCFEYKPQPKSEAPKSPTPFGLLERFVRWLKVLFCRHGWEYGESSIYNMPAYRWCKKCGQKQKYMIEGGCHGETWWQNVAT